MSVYTNIKNKYIYFPEVFLNIVAYVSCMSVQRGRMRGQTINIVAPGSDAHACIAVSHSYTAWKNKMVRVRDALRRVCVCLSRRGARTMHST